MPLAIEIKTGEGELVFRRQLIRFAEDVETPRVALEHAADRLREFTRVQMDSEGAHASGGWKPLSEGRVAEKARKGLDPRILRATGRLYTALTMKFDPEHVERLSASSLEFGTTVDYLVYHQSTRPRHVIPYRPPVALTFEDKRKLAKGLQRDLMGAVSKATWGA